MLYVSRVIVRKGGKWELGVVDTDDGVEESYNLASLINILRHNKSIKLNGVRYAHDGSIHDIYVYQLPEYVTRNQAKFKALYGVDVKTVDGDIRAINGYVKKDISIRLSDFGKTCNAYILRELVTGDGARVTIVLDDNISIGEDTFYQQFGGYDFDLCDVTDEALLRQIYSLNLRAEQFVDRDDRRDYYFGLKVLGELGDDRLLVSKHDIQDIERLNVVFAEKYAERFRKFLDDGAPTNIVFGGNGLAGIDAYFISSLKDSLKFGAEGIHMYYLNEMHFYGVLASCSNTDMETYALLSRYINNFGGTQEILNEFSKYIYDVVQWVVYKIRG